MTPRDFCYWLQGFFEIRDARIGVRSVESLSPKEVIEIRNHLDLVFKKETSINYVKILSDTRDIDGHPVDTYVPWSDGPPVSC